LIRTLTTECRHYPKRTEKSLVNTKTEIEVSIFASTFIYVD
jgi:hypothetical protein